MAKKADLLAQAKKLKLDVTEKNTITEIQAAIDAVELKSAESEAATAATDKIAELVETETIAEAIVEAEQEIEATNKVKVAKAGKRSSKAIAEAEEKQAKEERKAVKADDQPKAKPVIKTRSRVERAGKKFRNAAKLIDKNKEYSVKEGLATIVKTSTTKFDSTVELHVNLGVDPRHADQNIRANLVLPAGTGKDVKVAVFAEADDVAAAKKAGAFVAGNEELLAQLDKGIIDFDVLIATPAVMPKLGKYARVLGPKGLMPSPKSGTVTADVTKGVEEAKAGKVEYRVDSSGIVHLGVGKVSFGEEKLTQNVQAVLASIKTAKPASIKGAYVRSVHITTTMGPSIRIASSEV
jgi:ribosomal protein L1